MPRMHGRQAEKRRCERRRAATVSAKIALLTHELQVKRSAHNKLHPLRSVMATRLCHLRCDREIARMRCKNRLG